MMKDGCSVDMNECSISMSAMGILGAKGCKVDLKEVSFTSCMARAISLVGKESKLTMMQRCSIKVRQCGACVAH